MEGGLTETGTAAASGASPAPASAQALPALEALQILDQVGDAVVAVDREWRCTYANAVAVSMARLPAGGLLGGNLWELFPALAATSAAPVFRRSMEQRERASADLFYEPLGIWAEVDLRPAADGGLLLVARDVTGRKQAERREGELRAMLDGIPALVAYIGPDFRYRYANRRYSEWLRKPLAEILGRTPGEAFGGPAWRHIEPQLARALAGETVVYEMSFDYPDGQSRWVRPTYLPDRDPSGEVRGAVILVQDLTDLRRATEELRRSEQQYRFLANAVPQLVWVADAAGHTEYLNHYWYEYTGASREEGIGAWNRVVPAEDSAAMVAVFAAASGSRAPFEIEYRLRRQADGEFRWHLARATPVRGASGEIVQWIGTAIDIHDRKRAELDLRKARRDLFDILESITESFIALDRDWRFVYANARVAEKLGRSREELIGRSIWEIAPESVATDFYPKYHQVMRDRVPVSFEVRYPDNRWFQVHAHPTEAGMSAYIVDCTEQKRTEEALRQKAKLESIGLLAGGIAHDFNNLLVGILGAASLAQETIAAGRPEHDLVRLIADSAERAAALTRQMLTYAGKSRPEKQAVDLNTIVTDTVRLMRSTIPSTVRVEAALDPALGAFTGDAGQIQQVVLNLLTNAAEAIPQPAGGEIAIRTRRFSPAEPWTGGVDVLPPGDYAELEVSDTGQGMPAEVVDRIFDPFFTTKFTGRGLGLAAVQGIVHNHEGAIEVSSEPGRGTRFRVRLRAAAPATAAPAPAAEVRPGSGTVLVIDDEGSVRETCRRILERHGYRVLLASGAAEGIGTFRAHRASLAAVLLDLSMPEQNGLDVLRSLEREIDGVRVILSSGYGRDGVEQELKRYPSVSFLRKPYRTQELLRALQAQ
jgi:PAS domain S-box-containing protein